MLQPDAKTSSLLTAWLNHEGSALPVVRHLIKSGHRERAAITARMALSIADCKDREALEEALLEAINVPDGWTQALEEFARNPSVERWNDLMTFVPEADEYQIVRASVRLLMRIGCDGNVLFRCITQTAFTPDVYDLAKSGTVDPEVILERGVDSPVRPMWLALAAQAAFARGDRWNCIKWLREAVREAPQFSFVCIEEIRRAADDEFNAQLDEAGIPR